MTVKSFIPPRIDDDEHIIRRLGWAVVRQWSKLPTSVQRQLQEQAGAVHDESTVQLDQQINIFIGRYGNIEGV
jgi:hypothetical protein